MLDGCHTLSGPISRHLSGWLKATGTTLLVLPLLVLMTGCGSTSNPISKINMGNNNAMDMPAEVTATKELFDTSALATLSRKNPFTSLLDPPKVAQSIAAMLPEAALMTYDDPFDGFALGGIVYRAQKPMAILTISGVGSKIIHTGDTLSVVASDSSYRIKVAKIASNGVTLRVENPPPKFPAEYLSKTLSLKRLIGFRSEGQSKSGPGGASTHGVNVTPPSTSSNNARDTEGTNTQASLSNLPPDLQKMLGDDTSQ